MKSSIEGSGESTVEQRMSKLEDEFEVQRKSPQGEDTRIGACNEAFQELYIPRTPLYDIFEAAFEKRPDLSSVHANRLAVRALQRHGLRRSLEINYPESFLTKESWRELGMDILGDQNSRRVFKHDMLNNSVTTNWADRGKSVKLLALMMEERFDHPLRILELGCGQNHIQKKLMLNSMDPGFQFGSARVMRPMSGHELGSTQIEEDKDTGIKLNKMLSSGRIAIASSMGIDKETIKRRDGIEWVRSQFYPTEYLNPICLEEFDLLESTSPPNVHFSRADIMELADFSSNAFKRIMRHGPYDIVFIPTVLYQLSPEGINAADLVATRAANPENGLKVYQDFINVDPTNPNELVLTHWGPYNYCTIIEDMQTPGKKEIVFIWKGGRCDEVQIGPGELMVDGELAKAQELIDDYR